MHARARRTVAVSVVAAMMALGCSISHRDEVRMGEEYARELEAQLPIVEDAEVNRYLSVLGDSLARLTDERGLEWRFRLIDSREVNAFALPGGFVYVTRGIVERTGRMNQLAGVLGHEIAHVTNRHAVEQLEQARSASVSVTLACILTGACESPLARAGIDIGGAAVFAHYSREDEREADAEAVRSLVRAGIHPGGMVELLELLLAERERRPDALEAWFSTHPTEEERIENVRQLVSEVDSAILLSLVEDSPRFQAFRQRLASLPPVAAQDGPAEQTSAAAASSSRTAVVVLQSPTPGEPTTYRQGHGRIVAWRRSVAHAQAHWRSAGTSARRAPCRARSSSRWTAHSSRNTR